MALRALEPDSEEELRHSGARSRRESGGRGKSSRWPRSNVLPRAVTMSRTKRSNGRFSRKHIRSHASRLRTALMPTRLRIRAGQVGHLLAQWSAYSGRSRRRSTSFSRLSDAVSARMRDVGGRRKAADHVDARAADKRWRHLAGSVGYELPSFLELFSRHNSSMKLLFGSARVDLVRHAERDAPGSGIRMPRRRDLPRSAP
jgi:hypothetical protein